MILLYDIEMSYSNYEYDGSSLIQLVNALPPIHQSPIQLNIIFKSCNMSCFHSFTFDLILSAISNRRFSSIRNTNLFKWTVLSRNIFGPVLCSRSEKKPTNKQANKPKQQYQQDYFIYNSIIQCRVVSIQNHYFNDSIKTFRNLFHQYLIQKYNTHHKTNTQQPGGNPQTSVFFTVTSITIGIGNNSNCLQNLCFWDLRRNINRFVENEIFKFRLSMLDFFHGYNDVLIWKRYYSIDFHEFTILMRICFALWHLLKPLTIDFIAEFFQFSIDFNRRQKFNATIRYFQTF